MAQQQALNTNQLMVTVDIEAQQIQEIYYGMIQDIRPGETVVYSEGEIRGTVAVKGNEATVDCNVGDYISFKVNNSDIVFLTKYPFIVIDQERFIEVITPAPPPDDILT